MWNAKLSVDQANRRAGGRRRINAERKRQAEDRRAAIIEAVGMGAILLSWRGLQSRLAEVFDVNRSTICRDIEAIKDKWREERRCPFCREVILGEPTMKGYTRLARYSIWNGCTLKSCIRIRVRSSDLKDS
jgi:hypothetical protein